ncbi:putative Acid phosphatase [Helianthus anomalus]
MGFSLLILMMTIATSVASPIHLLMPHSGSAGLKHADLNCLSWRLAVETDNLKGWSHIPESCVDYVGHYMLGKQYREDCDLVAAEAYEYAKGLNLTGDGKDVWVFDIDETTLSNIPYYARDDGNAVEYKSGKRKELEEAGYRIRGNVGDQWSDLIGSNGGDRTFKVPDPMYYIG